MLKSSSIFLNSCCKGISDQLRPVKLIVIPESLPANALWRVFIGDPLFWIPGQGIFQL
ncbi:MAG: hypothetical protein H6753_03940 [Candidatus Omnitrophica bacterium]|nr:hypothetical protein [Candidatus Omnitrophota bacterium]